MLNNLLSFIGYQDGGLVFDEPPSFSDMLSGLDITLPPGYEDWQYEYDPAREQYLSGQFERGKEKAYSGLRTGFRDISEKGEAALFKARSSGGGGFSGRGDNLLGMAVQDIYSGIGARRGSDLSDYERLIETMEADAREDVRGDRETWERGAMAHLLDLQQLYGEPFKSSYDGDGGVKIVGNDWDECVALGNSYYTCDIEHET